MKKILFGLIFALSLFAFTGISKASAVSTQVGIVQGLVSKPDNSPADGASVSVVCNSNTQTDTTDSSGFYFVQYPDGDCVAGDTATVTATLGSLSGTNTGVMVTNGYNPYLVLDVAIVHVPLIPEFGLITGAAALTASAGSFLFLKRRKKV